MTRTLHCFVFILLYLALVVTCMAGRAGAATAKVLVLHSYHKGLGWTDNITRGIEEVFPAGGEVELFYEYMDTKRADDETHLANVFTLLAHKYRDVPLKAIISSDDHAFQYLLRHGRTLFHETPIVFCGVNLFKEEFLRDAPHITGVVESFSLGETLEAIATIHRQVSTVYVIADDTVTGRTNTALLQNIIPEYAGRFAFEFLGGLTMAELEDEVAGLPDTAVLLWLSFTTDSAGEHYSFEESFDRISGASRRPLYSMWDFGLGHGILGGKITSGFAHGRRAAEYARRILNGESPQSIPVLKTSPNQYIFDYGVMKRFGVTPAMLPADSMVINRPVTFYRQYKLLVWQVVFAFVMVAGVAVFASLNLIKRRLAETALKQSEEKYRQLVENANDAIFIAQDGRIAFANRRTLEIIGCTMAQALASPFITFIHPDDRQMVADNYRRRIGGDTTLPSTYSFKVVATSGEVRTVQLNAVIAEWEGRPATLNFVRDISDQIRMEQSLVQAQKLEALGTFAGGIAHDFNNLLMAIQGRASLMRVQLGDGHEPLLEHVLAIEEHVGSGASLTRQLLGSARGGKYNPQPVDLNLLLSRSAEMFGRTRKNIQVVRKLSGEHIVAVVDEQQIEQVLLNLFVNASHAMPNGGELHIGTSLEMVGTKGVGDHPLPAGLYVAIEVTDFGVGMDDVTIKRIFDPFFTTKDKTRGTGLGLASAYGIVKNHAGCITVRSAPGMGATFTVYLPASDQASVVEAERETPVMKGTASILLIDDEEMIREIGSALLTELGYTVTVVAGGREAVKLLQEGSVQIDLVILDLIMPDLDGAATFELIRAAHPQMPVIVASGYALDAQTEQLMARGCDEFMQKPFSLAMLSEAVEKTLAKRRKH